MDSPEAKPPRVAFLLGAGASVLAGVPTTASFVRKFQESVVDEALADQLGRVIVALEAWSANRGSELDVELLYETLQRLGRRADDFLDARLSEEGGLVAQDAAETLVLLLERFIVKMVFVDPDKVGFLSALRHFVPEGEPLHVFSTNYDTCIELACEKLRLRWEDGFAVGWDRNMFLQKGVEVCLHKLHGSVLWMQDETGAYRRSLVKPSFDDHESSEEEFFTGETCRPLLIYPARKAAYNAPYVSNLQWMRHVLEEESRWTVLIVIGYSFRDDDIRQVLLDAASRNQKLRVILVDPSAEGIFSRQLAQADGRVGSLRDRVTRVSLPLFDDDRGSLLRELAALAPGPYAQLASRESDYVRKVETSPDEWTGLARQFLEWGDLASYWRCLQRGAALDFSTGPHHRLTLGDLLAEARLCIEASMQPPPGRDLAEGIREKFNYELKELVPQKNDKNLRLKMSDPMRLVALLQRHTSIVFRNGDVLQDFGDDRAELMTSFLTALRGVRRLAEAAARSEHSARPSGLSRYDLKAFGLEHLAAVVKEQSGDLKGVLRATIETRTNDVIRTLSEGFDLLGRKGPAEP